MTNFSVHELRELVAMVKLAVCQTMNGRVPKYIETPFGMCFMRVCFLKNVGMWHYNATMIRRKSIEFEK